MEKRPPDRSGRRARSLGGSSANSKRRSGAELEPKRSHHSMDETKGRALRLEATDAQVRETMTAAIEFSADGLLQQVNEYECIRDLGLGAMAEVKLCRRVDKHTGEEELVAVKVFNKSLLNKNARQTAFRRRNKHAKGVQEDSQPLQNVRREVALMKKLVHPNVVRLLEVIDDPQNNLLFVAMEYVHNGAVMVWEEETGQYASPATGGVLPPKTAAAYFRGILDGLEFLHANHVVHRDLKPENVLLNKDGVAKIADFGVAHIFDDPEDMLQANGGDDGEDQSEEMRRHRYQLTQPEGTWSFWAPEVCSSSNAAGQRFMEAIRRRDQRNKAQQPPGTVNERTLAESDRRRPTAKHSLRRQGTYDAFAADVWAAGVCLWVFRFGTPPFYDPDPANLFLDICRQPLLFPDKVSEGDEKVLQQEADEAKRAAYRAATEAREAAKEAVEAAAAAKEVALAQGQEASNWLTGEVGEEMGSVAQDLAASSRGIQIQIPEEGEFDDDTDLQSPGQLPALGSGRQSHREGGGEKRTNGVTSTTAFSPAPAPATTTASAFKPKIAGPLVRNQVTRAAVAFREWGTDVSAAFDAWSTPPRKARDVKVPPKQEWFRRPRSGCGRHSSDRDRDNRDRGENFSGKAVLEGRERHKHGHMNDGGDRDGVNGKRRHHSQSIIPPAAASLAATAAAATGARGAKAHYYGRSASSPVMMHDDAFSSSEICGAARRGSTGGGLVGVRGGAGGGKKHSGTLRDLLTALLKKNVSERITLREAQEHPWMTRMCPRKGDGSGGGEEAGEKRRAQPPVTKVSVTAGEVKGAIVHINSLFVIAVKSRLTQRLARARNNIARRRLQATTGEKYGPSLSDTEQEHLRKVRDLTEALTKDESALVNHDLANEPERSLSDSDLPSATCSGAWQASVVAQRKRRGGYSRVAKRLYTRSASRAAKRDNIHHAINKYLGNPDGSGGNRKSLYKGYYHSYDGRRRGSVEGSAGHRKSRSGGRRPRSSSGHRQPLQAAPKRAPPIGGAAGLSGLTSIPKSLANQIPGPPDPRPRHPSITLVAPPNPPLDFSPNPPPPPRPRASEALGMLEIPDDASSDRVYGKAGSSETERSMQTLASNKGFESPSDSDSGSLSSDFSKSDGNFSFAEGVSDAGDDDGGADIVRSGTLTSFGSDASSRSGNSHRSRGSFSVFGIKRHTLKMKQLTKISRMSLLVKRGGSGSGSVADERDRDDGAGVRSMMMAPPPPREFKKGKAKPKEFTLGRLSGGVRGEKKQRGTVLNGKSPSKETKDIATGTRGYVSMASMASTSSVGASSEAEGEGGGSMASDASTGFRRRREARAVSPLTAGVSTVPNRSPSRDGGVEAARGNHRRPQAKSEPPWGPRGSKEIVGTQSVRRNSELRRKKEKCGMS